MLSKRHDRIRFKLFPQPRRGGMHLQPSSNRNTHAPPNPNPNPNFDQFHRQGCRPALLTLTLTLTLSLTLIFTLTLTPIITLIDAYDNPEL